MRPLKGLPGRYSHTLSRSSAPWPLGRHGAGTKQILEACCLQVEVETGISGLQAIISEVAP